MDETVFATNGKFQATLQKLTDLEAKYFKLQKQNINLIDENTYLVELLCPPTEEFGYLQSSVLPAQNFKVHVENEILLEEKKLVQEEPCQPLEELGHLTLSDLQANVLDLQSKSGEGLELHIETTQDLLNEYNNLKDDDKNQFENCTQRERNLIDSLKTFQEERKRLIVKQNQLLTELHELQQQVSKQSKERYLILNKVSILEVDITFAKTDQVFIKDELTQANKQNLTYQLEINRLTTILKSLCIEQQVSSQQCETECFSTINQDGIEDTRKQVEQHLDGKKNLEVLMDELQCKHSEPEERVIESGTKLTGSIRKRQIENSDMDKFRNDLLTAARNAKEFKLGTECEFEKQVMGNKVFLDKIQNINTQLKRIKEFKPQPSPLLRQTLIPITTERTERTVQQKMADSQLTVKSLIINDTKHVKSGFSESRSSTASHVYIIASDINMENITSTEGTPVDKHTSGGGEYWTDQAVAKSTSQEQQEADYSKKKYSRLLRSAGGKTLTLDANFGGQDNIVESENKMENSYDDLNDNKDPLYDLGKSGGSK